MPLTDAEFQRKIDGIIRGLEASLGKGSVMRPGLATDRVPVIPTGVLGIDRATGIAGIPRGRITEIYGPESSGKSTLALHVISEAQRLGLVAAYIDAEHALDPGYAEALHVGVDSLLLSQPDSGEQALEVTEALVRTGELGCIVIDSVASLVPRAEIEGEMGQSFVGLQARLMSQAMRKLTAVTARSGCALVFLNQLRERVGMSYGNPEVTPGGRALKFYSSLRIDMRRIGTVAHGEQAEAIKVKVKVVKNKMAPPYQQVECLLRFGTGFDKTASLIDAAMDAGEILKSGAWYNLNGQKFQGLNQVREYLDTHEDERSLLLLTLQQQGGVLAH